MERNSQVGVLITAAKGETAPPTTPASPQIRGLPSQFAPAMGRKPSRQKVLLCEVTSPPCAVDHFVLLPSRPWRCFAAFLSVPAPVDAQVAIGGGGISIGGAGGVGASIGGGGVGAASAARADWESASVRAASESASAADRSMSGRAESASAADSSVPAEAWVPVSAALATARAIMVPADSTSRRAASASAVRSRSVAMPTAPSAIRAGAVLGEKADSNLQLRSRIEHRRFADASQFATGRRDSCHQRRGR